MKETSNSWLIKEDYYDRNKTRRERNRKSRPDARFNVYICPKCNRVHEYYYNAGKGMETAYHDDFPRYKLEKIKCVGCHGQPLYGNDKQSIK